MLTITIPETELWDEQTNSFVYTDSVVVELEHSLVSLSKWESFYEKPFLNNTALTDEETNYYITCMCLTPNVDLTVFKYLSNENIKAVNTYVQKKHTATWFGEDNGNTTINNKKSVITAEIIYYWMITLAIPFEAQTWNLNRLLTLIKVINLKNQPPENLSKEEAASRAREINKRHRARMQNSK